MKRSEAITALVVVVLGLTVYHLVWGGASDGQGSAGLVEPDGVPERNENGEPRIGTSGLTGRSTEQLARRVDQLSTQVQSLARALRKQTTELSVLQKAVADLGGSVKAPAIPLEDAGSEGRFDEDSLRRLRAYMKEMERRDHALRHKAEIERTLGGLELNLSPELRDQLIEATYQFHRKLRARLTKLPRNNDEREQQAAEIKSLRADYRREVQALLPGQEADRVLGSILGRGLATAKGMDSGSPR